jgi:DNA-directed RNA polymerase specialized sigma24 family protein
MLRAHRDWDRQRAVARLPRPTPTMTPDPSEDQFWRDIADVLEISAGTVKASLSKARRSLARSLGAEE